MIGIVDVGGGLRGVYGAGVFDRCLEEDLCFDYLIGVSAGSANIAAFLAGQKERNLKFYTEYSFRKDYMGFGNLLKRGSYIDLEYVYGDALSNSGGESPLDYDAMMAQEGKTAKIVATDAIMGSPVYFDIHDMDRDDYGAIKASSCVPVINKAYRWKGRAYYDGGISDPIPFQKAFDAGCDRVVVILTRPRDYYRNPKKDRRMAKFLTRYPNSAQALINRAETYNRQLRQAEEYAKAGKLLIVAPDSIGGMGTLTKNRGEILKMYAKGKRDAQAILAFCAGH